MAEPTLNLIPHEHVEIVWPLAEEYIERSVEHGDGTVTIENHRDAVFNDRRQLWLIWDEGHEKKCRAAIVTEIINGLLHIWALGGERMREWLHLHHDLERWARTQGCRGMNIWGRPGWQRALGAYGYKKTLVAMNKEFLL
jgi:hypothetical protein